MRSKHPVLPALVLLCISAVFILASMAALAANDSSPPVINAWVSGEKIQVVASDGGSGVDAVVINDKRINYLVDSSVSVSLEDYAGTKKNIEVYAVDFAGNQSSAITLENPNYVAETVAASVSASTTTSSRSSAPSSSKVASAATPTPTPEAVSLQAEESPAASPAAIVEETITAIEDNPLTPDGTGAVLDNATEDEGKEFYTIDTPDGNVFYLVIDRQRSDHNVYFLNSVTESDLMALAEADGETVTEIPEVEEPTPTPEPTPEVVEVEPEPEEEEKNGIGSYILIILLVGAGIGVGYYFKVLKPKQAAALDSGFDDDFDDDDDYPEDDAYDFEDEEDDAYYYESEVQ